MDTETQGGRPSKDGGRDWSDTASEPRNSKDCWEPPKARKSPGRILPYNIQRVPAFYFIF